MAEFTVTLRLRPDQKLRVLSQLFSGLGDLAQERVLTYHTDMSGPVDPQHSGLIWLDVVRRADARAVCVAVDIADSASRFSEVGLATADLYFKRHYVTDIVGTLPDSVRSKIRPYGMWMPCLSRSV